MLVRCLTKENCVLKFAFMTDWKSLVQSIHACAICRDHLPLKPRPVLLPKPKARLLIVGQAPGIRVHQTGIAWNDPSGDRLRKWMGVSRNVFYEHPAIAMMPMGFCYPGKGKSGDLPPRKECAQTWHRPLLDGMSQIELTLLIGFYAQAHYLPVKQKSVREAVRAWASFLPDYFPLPHPSPRNHRWLLKNPWFEKSTLPALRRALIPLLNHNQD